MKIIDREWSRTSVYWTISLFILFICLFYQAFIYLVKTWYYIDHNSHGFFIIPATIYVIHKKKETLLAIEHNPSSIGIYILLSSLYMFYFGNIAGIMSLACFSIVLFIAGTIIYLFGLKLFSALIVPMIILCFMIPIPTQIYSHATMPLQLFVSNLSTKIAGFLNIPIYREGNVIVLPGRGQEILCFGYYVFKFCCS